jgi:hypothetical protein
LLTRRDFLAYCGGLTAASAAVWALPAVLDSRGWWSAAYAEDGDVVLDTFNALGVMIWPGNDAYSVAQGEWNERPGAVAANVGRHVVEMLDGLVAQPYTALPVKRGTVPLSGSLASAINSVALTVNPAAGAGGGFAAPFARLSLSEKAAVWRILEQDTRQVADRDPSHSLGVLQFLFGVLPPLVAFYAFSEVDVFDPATRTVVRRPLGWDQAGFLGDRTAPVEGWDDFLGYYQGHREVQG